MKTTKIYNEFTGYRAEVKTAGNPAVSTIRRHLRRAKAADCQSVTTVEIDGVEHDLTRSGLARR